MWKFALKMGIIIFVNLFAFLWLWYILDVLFWTGHKLLIVSLVLSIIPLIFIMFMQIWKAKKQLAKINNIKDIKYNGIWK